MMARPTVRVRLPGTWVQSLPGTSVRLVPRPRQPRGSACHSASHFLPGRGRRGPCRYLEPRYGTFCRRPGPHRPVRFLRRPPASTRRCEPVPQLVASLRAPAGRIRRRYPPSAHVLDGLRNDPPPGLSRFWRLRSPTLPPASDRGHRTRLSPDANRPPDHPGSRRASYSPEALVAAGNGPDRHLPSGCPVDAPDQAKRNRRDRPERQAHPADLRGVHGTDPARAGNAALEFLGRGGCRARIGGDRLAEPRLLPVSRPLPRPWFRVGGPAAASGLLHLLWSIGPFCPFPVAYCEPGHVRGLGRGRARKRVDQGAGPIPQPFLARVARRLARWTTRSR